MTGQEGTRLSMKVTGSADMGALERRELGGFVKGVG